MPMARQGNYRKWCEKYGFEFLRRLAEEGNSDEEIAQKCGLSFETFIRWKKSHPKFSDAIEIGRVEADFSVVSALYRKAIGYSVKTPKTYKLKKVDFDPDTGKKLREYEELAVGVDEDYIQPDLRAEMFWLKNRQPRRWGERGIGDDEAGGEVGVVEIPRADMIDEPEDNGES